MGETEVMPLIFVGIFFAFAIIGKGCPSCGLSRCVKGLGKVMTNRFKHSIDKED